MDKFDESLSRNVDIITTQEQIRLCTMQVLVAGCGSVGGSIVEPLIRLGLGSLILADPGTFELSNLNRQACSRLDIGRQKAHVLAERARAINPNADIIVVEDGVTTANLSAIISRVSIIFDGIDAESSALEKYLLHKAACKLRIPALSGMDFGGCAVVYIFNYLRFKEKPFYGRATEEAHRHGDLPQCFKWLKYRTLPADFLPIIADRLQTGKPWPQVSYCVSAMAALAARAIVDLGMGRHLPHILSFDTHMKSRHWVARIIQRSLYPYRLWQAYRIANATKTKHTLLNKELIMAF